MDKKPLDIFLHEIVGFIKICNGIRYLALYGSSKCDAIYNKIRYLKSQKNGITYTIDHNFTSMKIDSYNTLTKEKTLTFHLTIMLPITILIKSVF